MAALRGPRRIASFAARPGRYMRCGRFPLSRCSSRCSPRGGGDSGTPSRWLAGNVGANVGTTRACVAASNPEASLIRVGSLNAVPKKLMPTGTPSTTPAGTCTIG